MPVYDRPYMRYSPQPHHRNPLLWLAGIMLVLYFAQVFELLLFKSRNIEAFLALSWEGLMAGRVWTLVTYAFLHGGPLHLIFNLLIIVMVGRTVQMETGDRGLLTLSAVSALGGALAFEILHFGGPSYLVGASAIAIGYITVLCLSRPDEPMTFLLFFVVPVTVKPRYLLLGLVLVELIMLPMEFGGGSVVASSAHLGGMAAAALYFQKGIRRAALFPKRKAQVQVPPRRPRVVAPAGGAAAPRYRVNISNRSDLRSEVDRILDKINSQGFGSLTDEEKTMLDRAKDILSK